MNTQAEDPGEFGAGIDTPSSTLYWRERAAFWRNRAVALGHIADDRKESNLECHGLDNSDQVFFYEQDFYVLSNFSAFSLQWRGLRFDTSEAAYHWEKFAVGIARPDVGPWHPAMAGAVADEIRFASSAHEAFKIAERNKSLRRVDWEQVKVETMRRILHAKAAQHDYVRRKLLSTGDRTLIENSWRDDYWGWGPNRDGKNMLGKLWMEVRADLRLMPNAEAP